MMKRICVSLVWLLISIGYVQAQTFDPHEPLTIHLQGQGNPDFEGAYVVNCPHTSDNFQYSAEWKNQTGQDVYLLNIICWAGWSMGCVADTNAWLLIDGVEVWFHGWDHDQDSAGSDGNVPHSWTPPFLHTVRNGSKVVLGWKARGYNADNLYPGVPVTSQNYNFPHFATFNVMADVDLVITRQ